jgi:hypothetical protein
VTVLNRMMSIADDRPALTPLGPDRSTLGAALSEARLHAPHPLFQMGHR